MVTEFFTIFRAIKYVSFEILIHHAKQRPCNFPSKKKIPVFILEKYLSKEIKLIFPCKWNAYYEVNCQSKIIFIFTFHLVIPSSRHIKIMLFEKKYFAIDFCI